MTAVGYSTSAWSNEAVWMLLSWPISLLMMAGIIAIVYFTLPKSWRARHLWYRLPLAVGAVQLVIAWLVISGGMDKESATTWLYMLLNFPVTYVVFSPRASHWLEVTFGVDLDGAVFAYASVVFWVAVSFILGLFMDWKRRRSERTANTD